MHAQWTWISNVTSTKVVLGVSSNKTLIYTQSTNKNIYVTNLVSMTSQVQVHNLLVDKGPFVTNADGKHNPFSQTPVLEFVVFSPPSNPDTWVLSLDLTWWRENQLMHVLTSINTQQHTYTHIHKPTHNSPMHTHTLIYAHVHSHTHTHTHNSPMHTSYIHVLCLAMGKRAGLLCGLCRFSTWGWFYQNAN